MLDKLHDALFRHTVIFASRFVDLDENAAPPGSTTNRDDWYYEFDAVGTSTTEGGPR